MLHEYVLLSASIITALGIIFNTFKNIGKGSKKTVDKYIDNQIAPSLKVINDSLVEMRNDMNEFKKSSDGDKMQRLRYECLCFASDIRKGIAKTRQEYEEIFRMEKEYDKLIELYGIENGFMEEEMLFVHEQYRKLKN